jgi:outer membrane lipoprotein-sorting protein
MRYAAAALALLSLGAGALPGQTDKGATIVLQASKKYQALSSFEAQFRQHFEDSSIDNLPDARGTLYQEGKNLLAMRFSDPPKEAIVLDGNFVYQYLPSTSPGIVKKFPQQNHPTYGTNFVGVFLDNPLDRYRITYVTSELIDGHTTDEVMMEPIKPGELPFRRANVWFDRELGLPRKLHIEEQRNRARVLYLTSLRQNISIPPEIFTCDVSKLPKGTRVISQ